MENSDKIMVEVPFSNGEYVDITTRYHIYSCKRQNGMATIEYAVILPNGTHLTQSPRKSPWMGDKWSTLASSFGYPV